MCVCVIMLACIYECGSAIGNLPTSRAEESLVSLFNDQNKSASSINSIPVIYIAIWRVSTFISFFIFWSTLQEIIMYMYELRWHL